MTSHWIDRLVERGARRLAQQTSRRSFLARVGTALVGVSGLPLLPVARADEGQPLVPSDAGLKDDLGDPKSCNYWRHCAIDGFACACCGGTQSACPPGTEMSPITWIGTCRNPGDGKDYVISYNDCCGKSSCGRCFCNRNEGDLPMYIPPKNNDTNWCQGTKSNVYHSTIAAVIGVAVQE